jgi:hypothetical protein
MVIRAQAPAGPGGPVAPVPPPGVPPPPPPYPGGPGLASPEEGYNCGVATAPATAHPILEGGRGFVEGVGGCVQGILKPCDGRGLFQSDHCFDTFISPVSNPFYFEDPRALTEVRPILLYQRTPSSTPHFAGGSVEFFGLQARAALTQRLSLVVSELGLIHIDPHAPADGFQAHTGFAEVHLGPQYTFIRDEKTGTLLAGGLQLEIPAGPGKVFQDTGDLSLDPYVSFGQAFGRTNFGMFHFLNTTGFDIASNHQRSNFFYSNFHLDFDVLNQHHFYPLLELDYQLYTRSGNSQDISFEGGDLINFGSAHVAGENNLSIAAGFRFKFNECIQLGFVAEFPLLNRKDLLEYRLLFDMIFRY